MKHFLPHLPPLAPNILLQAHGLSASYGASLVLNGIDLALPRGQWWAVVGANGAGKSTLLRCLAGLEKPLSGQVQWPVNPTNQRRLAQACKFAWLDQESKADDNMRVQEVVALGRLPHQSVLGWVTPSPKDRHAVAQALIDTDMAWAKDRCMGQLSAGERQRVHVARTLAVQAPVMLLDEPLHYLDAPHQKRLVQVLRQHAQNGGSVISVLHELAWALFAHGLIVMQAGKIVAQGATDQPAVHRALEAVFESTIRVEQVQGEWVVVYNV